MKKVPLTIVFGPPGTGKTRLAYGLNSELNKPLWGRRRVYPGTFIDGGPSVAELKRALRDASRVGLAHLIAVYGAEPPEEALDMADFIVETKAGKKRKK